MRPSPSQLLHKAIGSPRVDGCSEANGLCYVCAGPVVRGKPVVDWCTSSYTDQNRARCPAAIYVCEACCMLAARTFPVPGRPPGQCSVCEGTGTVKKIPPKGKGKASKIGDACPKCGGTGEASFGGNFRNYSHLYEEGWDSPSLPDGTVIPGYLNASKGEKPIVLNFLRRDHHGMWFAAIADSGQKHVVHHTPPNLLGPGGTVLFEETLVSIPPGLSLVDEMTALLTAGATKEEILIGEYSQFTWLRLETAIREFEGRNAKRRHTGWFRLALWLSQRDEAAVAIRIEAEKAAEKERKARTKQRTKETQSVETGRKKASRNTSCRDAVIDPRPVCEGQRGEGKAGLPRTDPKPSQNKCRNVTDHQSVGERASNRPTNAEHRHVGQLSLFNAP